MPIITDTNLKAYLKPGGISGSQHDAVVTWAVNAANQAVVAWCGRTFDDVGAASARVFNPRSCYRAVVDDFHTITGLVVKTDDNDDGTFETTWDAADYELGPLNQLESGITVPYHRIVAVGTKTFPIYNRRVAVQVTARWGWAATGAPAAVIDATLIKAARLFHRHASPQGVAGFDQFGPVRITKQEDPDVVSLLGPPFRRPDHVVGIA